MVTDITEEIPDRDIIENIEDVKLPQVSEQLHAEDVDMPQVHHIEGNAVGCAVGCADQFEQFDNEGLYVSPINHCIEASCAQLDSSWYNLLLPNSVMFQFIIIHEQIARHSFFMASIPLSLSLTQHRKRKFGMEKMLEWLHWLYAYT